MDVEKIIIVDEEEEFPAIARLIELGRQKSYVTLDDILHFFPEAIPSSKELFCTSCGAGLTPVIRALRPDGTGKSPGEKQ